MSASIRADRTAQGSGAVPPIIVRTLRHEFRIRAPDRAAADALAFMAIEPEIAGATLVPVDLKVEADHGFLSLALPDGRIVSGNPGHILSELHGLILRDAIESEAGAPFLHCATIVGPWGRAALIGSKGSGKSTLALHLLANGHAVEGDEHLVVAGDVIARPRTLRVKQGSLALLPALRERIARSPSIQAWDGALIHAVDPSIAGTPWRIGRGGLDALVFVEPNHGGRSVMTPMGTEPAFRLLMAHSLLSPRGIAAATARLRNLALSVPAFRLSLGDLAGAQRHLELSARFRANDPESLRNPDVEVAPPRC